MGTERSEEEKPPAEAKTETDKMVPEPLPATTTDKLVPLDKNRNETTSSKPSEAGDANACGRYIACC